ncbi:hypothetical protein TVAG_108850 [Trichomonas vaginalis G3]|uniref:Uncharacterized protein n=1 Tax=Trichomonas vaginalis (strain ATCC PRA-98 / G3) TaxID=412133 RepID=A2F026_TRIV3|nr:Ankyrin repeat family [Trichomonas vaginalis G3]EAY01728.1 hypothetical protein TVAG_108850 [Trichomonas vaginalis G3]KAI5532792.1 Ankyrin repeat family [Trichomonas vaginalis G3]|eukprot:XP_001314286.1 hypothetical protein [Trichomonas vaginalis G3]
MIKEIKKIIHIHFKLNKEITIVLISRGVDINGKDKIGNIALHYASVCNSKERDELLTS